MASAKVIGFPFRYMLANSHDAGDAMQYALGALSIKLRAAIMLKELEGLSYEEIADVLNISIGTVKSRISRARKELKQQMKKLWNKSETESFKH